MAAIEDALIDEFGNSASVDGHDFGSGEFNIFIFTDDPVVSFQRVQKLLQASKPDGAMNAAYRDIDEEEYIIVWPPDLKNFEII